MFKPILNEFEESMNKSVEYFKEELSAIRAGRANPKILDKVMVDYYGVETPVPQTSNVSTPEPRLLQIKPFDVSLISEIERAINSANLGFNATNDGKVIRIAMPILTEERRKDLVKQVKAMSEECKVAIRNLRRTAIDHAKKLQKDEDLPEDNLTRVEKEIQNLTDAKAKEIEDVLKHKEAEILEI